MARANVGAGRLVFEIAAKPAKWLFKAAQQT